MSDFAGKPNRELGNWKGDRSATESLFFKCVVLILSVITLYSAPAIAEQDSFFSKIGDAITGHVKDAMNRLSEGSSIGGSVVYETQLREGLPGSDSVHYGTGTVTLEEKEGAFFVQFGEDTRIGFAPDLTVYISTEGDIVDEAGFEALAPILLGEMTKPNGASFYPLPANVRPDEIKSIVVWCRRFSEFMTSAVVDVD